MPRKLLVENTAASIKLKLDLSVNLERRSIIIKYRKSHLILSAIAIVFGTITIIVGLRVNSGVNPGYQVFLPLLYFNTAMGLAYVYVGITIWRNIILGKKLSLVIFSINFMMLLFIVSLSFSDNVVATQSVAAMAFRTALWLMIFLGLFKMSKNPEFT